MSQDKQLFQVKNILNTITEATDHFTNLIKNKELNQSILMFTSIVEGCQSVFITLNSTNEQFTQYTTKLENFLHMITNELERGNFIKIAAILQFSFRPQLLKLNEAFIEIAGNQQKETTISIGVFNSWRNPLEFTRKQRVEALVDESHNQNAVLYFFTSDDVDFKKKQVRADTYGASSWKSVIVPFPDVIDNIGAGRRSQVERKLRREVPFTTFHVGNKYTLPKRMIKNRKYVDLLVPFKVCSNEKIIYDFLEENNQVVFKALGSNRGENIFFITKKGNRYVMLDQQKERILNADAFHIWIQNAVLKIKSSYIIQRYIHTRTKADEPYHFRATVQKGREGKWVLTDIYANIGKPKGNLSNLSAGGKMEEFKSFLVNNFGENMAAKYEKELSNLSLNIVEHLDKLYSFTLSELGIDFAIDEKGKIWMHEANNGPQTDPIEDKRAIHKVGYAKYIAENGIMYTETATKSALTKGYFQASISDLPFAQLKGICIGMLAGKKTDDPLTIALAKEAKAKNVQFYQFSAKDIDFDYGLIKADFYEDGKWISKIAEYPDVIIDRLKLRGKEEAQILYEELEDIPFTNEWTFELRKRSNVYETLQSNKSLANILPDFQRVTKPRHVFQFIEKYQKVLMKPENTAYATISIEQMNNNEYLVTRGVIRKKYREMPLQNFIKEQLKEESFFVQVDSRFESKDGERPEIHIHLMKNENEEWTDVSQYVQILKPIKENRLESKNETLTNFIKKIDGIDNIGTLETEIRQLTVNAASVIEEASEKLISEVAFILSIDENLKLSLMEINPSGPSTVYDEKKLANITVLYAKSLAFDIEDDRKRH